MELVVDPCKAGNALRYINDYQGMPVGITKNVATVEVFDHDTLRPHILFFTIEAVLAGEELLMDYGEVGCLPWGLFEDGALACWSLQSLMGTQLCMIVHIASVLTQKQLGQCLLRPDRLRLCTLGCLPGGVQLWSS